MTLFTRWFENSINLMIIWLEFISLLLEEQIARKHHHSFRLFIILIKSKTRLC